MGSFNVGCVVSGLTVHESDRVGFMAITPKLDHRTGQPQSPESRSFYLYTHDLYEPFLPPVYGVYGDYGRIEDLEESAVTQVYEAIFLRPAVDVLNAIGCSRELYDTYGEIAALYLTDEAREAIGGFNTPAADVLPKLGFEAAKPHEGFLEAYTMGEYTLSYKFVPFGDTDISHNSWTLTRGKLHTVVFSDLVAYNGYSSMLSAFAKETGLLPGFKREEWSAVRALSELSGTFFLRDIYEEIRGPVGKTLWDQETPSRWAEDFDRAKAAHGRGQVELANAHLFQVQRVVGMRDQAHWDRVLTTLQAEDFSEISFFLSTLMATNRMLMPCYNGEQFGNDAASQVLAKSTMKLLKARLRDQED